ncbi:MAG: L-threonylcarbamoyladenylate synthase [Breznakia sp.]
MNTHIFKQNELDEVRKWILAGKVVAFPTDTVFGVGVVWDNEAALKRLKLSKKRSEDKPIPLMVSSFQQIEEVAYVNAVAKKVIAKFMPGGCTIILKKKKHIPEYVSNGFDTIAIRMPDDDFLLSILKEKAMLVTSANISGEETAKSQEEVLLQLNGRIDAIVLGEAGGGIASSIIDLSERPYQVIREGLISVKEIKKLIEEDV